MSESASGCGGGDGPPPLLMEIPTLITTCVYACIAVVALMCAHYVQPLAQAASKAHAQGEGASSTFEANLCCSKRTWTTYYWEWARYLDWPWLEAEFEGDAL